MLGKMATGVRLAWTIHRQQGSQIPPDTEAARRYLRRGNLAEALLPGGPGPALVAGDLAVSHDELRAAAGQAASWLQQAGVTRGTHVAMFAENSGAWIISYLGPELLGATVVGMNPAFKAAEAEQILTDSEAAAVLVDAGRQPLVDALRPRLNALRTIVRVEDIGFTMPPPQPSPASGGGSVPSLGPESPALFVAGSAPLPATLFARCERILGQPVLERYGITEGGIVVSNPYDGPRQPGRVGFPLPGVEVRLGDKEEVQLKGGQVFKGYWRNAAASTDAFTDGWFRTGDVGEIAQDGTLAIRGRIKELIISGGYNVYPREVEMVLEQHPAVAEVAVAGLPSDRWGEEVTAFVVARTPVDAQDLIAYTRERLSTYKFPRAVRFIDAIPRNAMGKVDRSQLK